MSSSDVAKFETIIRFSRCERVRSVSRVKLVMPMMPFMGVRISCDTVGTRTRVQLSSEARLKKQGKYVLLARNSDLLLLANSAASLACVFRCSESRREDTISLIWFFSEFISPEASTVTKELKSPAVAAAEIWAKART